MECVIHATESHRAAVVRMAQRFLSPDGPYGTRFAVDAAKVSALAAQMMGPEHLALLAMQDDQPVGMFGMFLFDHPITGERIASELCWWMEPEARGGKAAIQMLRTAEAWARDHGAEVIEMIAPDERVAAFYGKVGYERADIHYRKVLWQ